MFLLNVDANDWLKAKAFFKSNPSAVKMNKKQSGCSYSFIKLNDTIVAVGYKLGAGTFGVVKVAEDDKGKNYAIKVEGGRLVKEDIKEEEILKLMNYSYGMIQRQLDSIKTFIPNTTMEFQSKHKKYKLLELLEGTDLIFKLYDKHAYEKLDSYVPIHSLNQEQKLIIAIKFCQILQQLQNLRIIHADIKPENIKVKIENGLITVKIMDFGFSMLLPTGSRSIVDCFKGTGPYMAPEIFNTSAPLSSALTFSFESDIYATGVMFETNFGFSDTLCKGMLKENPLERDTVEIIIKKLMGELKGLKNLSKEAIHFIEEIEPPLLPISPILPLVPTPQVQTTSMPKRIGLPKVMLDQDIKVQLKPTTPKLKEERTSSTIPAPMFKLKPIQKDNKQTLAVIETQEPRPTLLPLRNMHAHNATMTNEIVKKLKPNTQKPIATTMPKQETAETSAPLVRKVTARPLPIPQKPMPMPLPQMQTLPQKQVQPSPHKVDFATIKPSELKINRVAMLKKKIEQEMVLDALLPSVPKPSPVVTVAFDTMVAKPHIGKLTKIGVATPFTVTQIQAVRI